MESKSISLNTCKTSFYTIKRFFIRVLYCAFPRAAYQHKLDACSEAIHRERIRQVYVEDCNAFFSPQQGAVLPQKPIDILLPVYNGFEYLRPCLDSLLKHTDLPFHIYIADDKSPDERVLPLLREYQSTYPDKITLIENQQNQGWLQNINMLFARTKHDCVMLNSDTEVAEGWASRLLAPIFSDQTVAAAGPWSNAACLQSIWFRSEEEPLKTLLSTVNDLAGKFALPAIEEMPYLAGFCLVISRKALDHIGGLDPVYGKGYFEEVDWLERALHHGYKVALSLRAFVYHKGTGSFSSEQRRASFKKNARTFRRRYPKHSSSRRRAQYCAPYAAARFLLLANYLRAADPTLKLVPAEEGKQNTLSFTWKAEKDHFLYELEGAAGYEAIRTKTAPQEMQRITDPREKTA